MKLIQAKLKSVTLEGGYSSGTHATFIVTRTHSYQFKNALQQKSKANMNTIPRIISPVSGSFITAAVRPTPELPRPVVY